MKRILVLSLALILAVSSMVVPSYAASTEEYTVHDLLVGVEYNFTYFQSDGSTKLNTLPSPSTWVSNANRSEVYWNVGYPTRFVRVVFTLYSRVQPDSVTLFADSSQTQAVLLNQEGNYFQYEVTYPQIIDDYILIQANYSNYTGEFAILSCFGYLWETVKIDSVDWFSNAICTDVAWDEWGNPIEGFLNPISAGSGVSESLPVSVGWNGEAPTDYVLDHGEFFTSVTFDDTYQYADNVTFMVFACDQIYDVGATLTLNGSYIAGLESSVTYCGQTKMVYELTENYERVNCYLISVDVSDYKIGQFTLELSFNISKSYSSAIIGHEYGYFVNLQEVVLTPPKTYEITWYNVFSRWLKTNFNLWFNTLSSNLTSGFNSVVTSFQTGVSTLSSNLTSGFNSVVTSFQTGVSNLVDKIEQVRLNLYHWLIEDLQKSIDSGFQSLIDILNSSGDTEVFQNEVDQQGDKLDQMDDALSSVTKPALDRVDTNISGIVSDTDLVNTAHVYTYIIDDNIMAPALTMVTILAMMSFALFGKR